jgi:hypothetical protein
VILLPAYLDNYDVTFSWNGDLDLDSGDIRINREDGLRSLREQVHSVVASSRKDWAIYPGLGASLYDFLGEPNSRRTGNAIKQRLFFSLINSGIVAAEDLEIKVVPVHIHKILIIINIKAISTPYNTLNSGDIVQVSFIFNSFEQQVYFMNRNNLDD